MDVSADLMELGRTPIAVISAGIKSILDIARTLEYLETQGVCVAAYNSSRDFPSFFTPTSGYLAPFSVQNAEDAAKLIVSRDRMKLQSGILIAVPIPEEHSPDGRAIEEATQTALQEAREKCVLGKEVTPYVLQRVNELTGGASLRANIALIKNNAKVASQIAVQLSRMKQADNPSSPGRLSVPNSSTTTTSHDTRQAATVEKEDNVNKPVIIGGTIIDFIVTPEEKVKMNGGTFSGQVFMTFGGVGRNVADCLNRLDQNPLLISAVGDDFHGEVVRQGNLKLHNRGMETLRRQATAVCCVMLDDTKECSFLVADMKIHQLITPEMVSRYEKDILKAPIVVIDGNIPVETMDYVLDVCQEAQVPVWFEPTDLNKAAKIFQTKAWKSLCFASPNVSELRMMNSIAFGTSSKDLVQDEDNATEDLQNLLQECVTLSRPFMEHLSTLVVTLGHKGVLLITSTPSNTSFPLRDHKRREQKDQLHATYFPPLEKKQKIVSVSGAGDCLAGAVIGAILRKETPNFCIKAGLQAAQFSLLSREAVPATINASTVYNVPQNVRWQPVRIDID